MTNPNELTIDNSVVVLIDHQPWVAFGVKSIDPGLLINNVAGLAARGATPSAFERRCIPSGCVAPPSNSPAILGRRALPAGRIAALGATTDLRHGLLAQSARDLGVPVVLTTVGAQGSVLADPIFKEIGDLFPDVTPIDRTSTHVVSSGCPSRGRRDGTQETDHGRPCDRSLPCPVGPLST